MAKEKDNAAQNQENTELPPPPEPPALPLDYEACCEVQLTAEQKRIVKAETGRDMDVLIIEDSDGNITRNMTSSTPDDFTVMAIRQARRLNEYDADFHQYLIDLDEWQKSLNEPDPGDQMAEAAELAAIQEAERLKLFFQAETDACADAREIAKIAWGKKDKTV